MLSNSGHKDHKLITADARYDVAVPEMRRYPGSHLRQHGVAKHMAVPVIHQLKIIYIYHKHGRTLSSLAQL